MWDANSIVAPLNDVDSIQIFKQKSCLIWAPRMAFSDFKVGSEIVSHVRLVSAPISPVLQLTGGISHLFKRIQDKRRDPSTSMRPVRNSFTDQKGFLLVSGDLPYLFNRYRVKEVIGEGTFSQLVSADDLYVRGRRVAIKVMNANYEFIGVQEFEKLSSLCDSNQQAHIVQLYSSFHFDRHFCIVMEILDACLLKLLKSNPNSRFTLDEVRKVAIQLVSCFAYLKQRDIIHADLKPENVLLATGKRSEKSMHIKLIDFGNAMRSAHIKSYCNTYELQTLYYRAPEVLLGVPFNFAIDMWSLGCLLAELLTGRPLFCCRSPSDLFRAMTSLLGPFPAECYSKAKFASSYFSDSSSKLLSPAPFKEYVRMNALSQALSCRDRHFLTLLCGLLEYDPSLRLTPEQALQQPFFSSLFPFPLFFGVVGGGESPPAAPTAPRLHSSLRPWLHKSSQLKSETDLIGNLSGTVPRDEPAVKSMDQDEPSKGEVPPSKGDEPPSKGDVPSADRCTEQDLKSLDRNKVSGAVTKAALQQAPTESDADSTDTDSTDSPKASLRALQGRRQSDVVTGKDLAPLVARVKRHLEGQSAAFKVFVDSLRDCFPAREWENLISIHLIRARLQTLFGDQPDLLVELRACLPCQTVPYAIVPPTISETSTATSNKRKGKSVSFSAVSSYRSPSPDEKCKKRVISTDVPVDVDVSSKKALTSATSSLGSLGRPMVGTEGTEGRVPQMASATTSSASPSPKKSLLSPVSSPLPPEKPSPRPESSSASYSLSSLSFLASHHSHSVFGPVPVNSSLNAIRKSPFEPLSPPKPKVVSGSLNESLIRSSSLVSSLPPPGVPPPVTSSLGRLHTHT